MRDLLSRAGQKVASAFCEEKNQGGSQLCFPLDICKLEKVARKSLCKNFPAYGNIMILHQLRAIQWVFCFPLGLGLLDLTVILKGTWLLGGR